MAITTIPQLKAWLRANLLPPGAPPRFNSAARIVSVLETMLDLLATQIRGDRGEQGVQGPKGDPGTITQYSSLEVSAVNPDRGEVFKLTNGHNASGRKGVKAAFHQSGLSIWLVGQPGGDVSALVVQGWGGDGSYPEYLRIVEGGKVGIGTTTPAEKLDVNGTVQLADRLRFPASDQARRIELFPGPNDHQYLGFGTSSYILRYQIPSPNHAHVWFCGLSPATSRELASITGEGVFAARGLRIDGGLFNSIFSSNGDGNTIPTINQPGVGQLTVGANLMTGTSDLAIINTNQVSDSITFWRMVSATTKKLLLILKNGFAGIGTNNPTSGLHVNGPAGHNQLRAEQPYTPASPNDPNGQPGQMAWDDQFFYVKTGAGWRRIPLQSW